MSRRLVTSRSRRSASSTDRLDQLAFGLGAQVGVVAQRGRGAGDGRERRAQVVRHGRQQRRAHLLGLGAQGGLFGLIDRRARSKATATWMDEHVEQARWSLPSEAPVRSGSATSTPMRACAGPRGTQRTLAPGRVSVPSPPCGRARRSSAPRRRSLHVDRGVRARTRPGSPARRSRVAPARGAGARRCCAAWRTAMPAMPSGAVGRRELARQRIKRGRPLLACDRVAFLPAKSPGELAHREADAEHHREGQEVAPIRRRVKV